MGGSVLVKKSFGYILILLLLIIPCYSYTNYTLESDKICSPTTNSKSKILLGRNENSAAIVKETRYFNTWLGDYRFKCKFEVKASRSYGIYAMIQKLSLRRDSNGDCIDYILFKRNSGLKSDKICGEISDATYDRARSTFNTIGFDDPGGEMDVNIFVSKHRLLETEQIDLEVVFTAYKDCSRETQYFEGCDTICIWKDFFFDGIVNCPLCSDEGGCKTVPAPKSKNTGTKVTVGVVVTVAVSFALFFTCLWILKRRRKLCWAHERGNERQGVGARVEMSHTTGSGDQVQPNDHTPSAPPLPKDKDLPPPYEALFPGR